MQEQTQNKNKNRNKKENKKTKLSKETQLIIYKLMSIVLMLILIVILGKWGYGKYVEYRSAKLYEDMMNQVNNTAGNNPQQPAEEIDTEVNTEEINTEEIDTEEADTEDSSLPDDVDIPQKNLDWEYMHGLNKDIYAWITIPNTQIDYPILQHETDDSYYLSHNIDGSKGYPGCIYTEKANYKDFLDFNTVIYGHNMKSGTMFRNLHDFEDRTFFDNNKYIYIYTEEETMVYEIYAAYTTNDAHILNTNDFSTELGRQAYLEASLAKAEAVGGYVRDDVDVTSDCVIVTLSTCTSQSDQRYLVQAVRIK